MWRFRFYKKRIRFLISYLIGGGAGYYEVNGIKLFYSTPYHKEIARTQAIGVYEQEIVSIWMREVKKSSLIHDIGGFNGFYGLLAAKHNTEARVYIFEPDKVNARHVLRNIERNKLTNCFLVEAVASNENGFIRFKDSGSSGSRVAAWGTLHKAVRPSLYGSPELLKVDCEGHEREALRGSNLDKTNVIFVEKNFEINLRGFSAKDIGKNILFTRA